MPFGAAVLPGGGVAFRLWAPAAHDVELSRDLSGREIRQAMTAQPEGWYTLTLPDAQAGDCYRFRIDGELSVPDPVSRFQPEDVHGPSQVIDPAAFAWQDDDWHGRPWSEAVIYELHVGTYTPDGTFAGVERHLDHLARLGVTAVELMPVADFPGQRNWGYDGVLPFAPDSRYGRPEALKSLVQAAHARGLMMLLDVVYNHFGPEGNYLHRYAPAFFNARHRTPWGDAINFDGPGNRIVRDFFIHNALYWLEEFHFDGLRLDAVHAICDDSRPDILEELSERVARGPGQQRVIHLVLENDHNAAHYLRASKDRSGYAAQWNDDLHHAAHVLLTGEHDGYYSDYAADPLAHLGRCLTEGFAYQGEPSPFRDNAPRGEPSRDLPPQAFVGFLQNHDQVGNRAFGDRLATQTSEPALRALTAILLLAPSPPLLFMGQEWATRRPFPFFCDFHGELADAVTRGRRREFSRFPQFRDPAARDRIPDPNHPATFASAVLDWQEPDEDAHRAWLDWHRELLAVRHRVLDPRLPGMPAGAAHWTSVGARALQASWRLNDGSRLTLVANLDDAPCGGTAPPVGQLLFATTEQSTNAQELPAWSVYWSLTDRDGVTP